MKRLFDMIRKNARSDRPLRHAVCVCAIQNNKVLGVARRGTRDEWGLIGGKADWNEDLKQALIREAWKETGLKLYIENLTLFFQKKDPPFIITTYLYEGEICISKQTEGLQAQWIKWENLTHGPFGEYNMELKNKIHSHFNF